MKKVFLSLSLFFTFAAYVLYVRMVGANAPVAPVPVLSSVEPSPSGSTPSATSGTGAPLPPPVINTGKYKNGSYQGSVADAYYGNVQVRAIISGGKITDVQFLNYPQDRQTSVRINSRAMPYLISEAITLQDANVDTVSGASFTSVAFSESLSSALAQARI